MFKTIEAKASKEQAKKQKMSKWFSMPSLDEPWNRNSYKGKRYVKKPTSLDHFHYIFPISTSGRDSS